MIVTTDIIAHPKVARPVDYWTAEEAEVAAVEATADPVMKEIIVRAVGAAPKEEIDPGWRRKCPVTLPAPSIPNKIMFHHHPHQRDVMRVP